MLPAPNRGKKESCWSNAWFFCQILLLWINISGILTRFLIFIRWNLYDPCNSLTLFLQPYLYTHSRLEFIEIFIGDYECFSLYLSRNYLLKTAIWNLVPRLRLIAWLAMNRWRLWIKASSGPFSRIITQTKQKIYIIYPEGSYKRLTQVIFLIKTTNTFSRNGLVL